MVLHVVSTIISETLPSKYYLPAAASVVLLVAIRAYSQGRRTNRDRDLHGRTIIATGAFTPIGLTLLEHLAKKGAHIIALVPTPSLTSHHAELLSLLRSTTSNDAIYAEPCPLNSPSAIKSFCKRFVNTENEPDRRVDALIMAHEYGHIGTWATSDGERLDDSLQRDEGNMATFLLTTLLLPALLVAPVDRDIRIISLVNPFYTAAVPAFNPRLSYAIYNNASISENLNSTKSNTTSVVDRRDSSWNLEGQRALRTVCFMGHLQRILDALPELGSVPASSSTNASPGSGASTTRAQKSNILAVTVSPGISRTDTVAAYLVPSGSSHKRSLVKQWAGAILYVLLLPLWHLLTKTPTSALQTVVHVLCVPKPRRRRRVPLPENVAQSPPGHQHPQQNSNLKELAAEEVLVPGALYADCSIVRLDLRVSKTASMAAKDEADDEIDPEQWVLGLGGERVGRAVWEALEEGVKIWQEGEKSGKAL